MHSRRKFLKNSLLGTAAVPFLLRKVPAEILKHKVLIKPPALKSGDTIGLIAPASPLIESQRTLIEATEKIEALGFRVKAGKNILSKRGYLAGTIAERVADIHDMFSNPEIRAIMAISGGYGSAQLLPHLDYKRIQNNPKILIGYSDITALLNGIHRLTGLVTFHGPVAISTFTDFTQKYFYRVLGENQAIGEIEDAPFEDNLQTSNRIWAFRKGIGEGKLIGGNLTLLQAMMGTPYEIDTKDALLFFEEVDEAPYDLDRILNQFKQAGKFDQCKGVLFDKLPSIKPYSRTAGFNNSLSVEEVIADIFDEYDFPVCIGFSLGHIKDKPTLPLGIRARLDANTGRLSLLEAAVI